MTTNEAAELWGISPDRAAEWCQKGRIKGAKKVMRPEWSHPRWMIPDGTKRPVIKRGRPTLEPYDDTLCVEEEMPPRCDPEVLEEETARMPDPTGFTFREYVWANQDRPIKRIAEVLNISRERVTELYDQALAEYI